ncbi:MAG: hypothetical protein ACX94B_07980 [Henriciella sp.]
MQINPTILTPELTGTAAKSTDTASPTQEMSEDTKLRFEQMLWAELLTHTGLEKSLTLGGGDGASMFSRYFVEAIAADIAEQHPLGLLDRDLPQAPESRSAINGDVDE